MKYGLILLLLLLPTLAIAQGVGQLEPWLENDPAPKVSGDAPNLDINSKDLINVGNITGTDVDISAGTGDFTTTGTGAFGTGNIAEIGVFSTTAMIHSTSGNLFFGAFGTESTLTQSDGQLKFFGASMIVPGSLRLASYETSRIELGTGGADTEFENSESGGFVFRTNVAEAAADTNLVSIDGSGNINILQDGSKLTLGVDGAADSYLEWNTAGATDHLLIYSLGGIQLGDAATEIHGINTAPVAAQMLTALQSHDIFNTSAYFFRGTQNHSSNKSSEGFTKGFDLVQNISGSHVTGQTNYGYSVLQTSTVALGVGSHFYSAFFGDAFFNGTIDGAGGTSFKGGEFISRGDLGTTGVMTHVGVSGTATGTADVNTGGFFSASGATANWAVYAAAGNIAIRSDSSYIDLGAIADDYKIQWDGNDAVHTITAGDFAFMGGKFGAGTLTPNAPLEVKGLYPGNVGGFPSGLLHVRTGDANEFSNSVITGHNSFEGNTQLWYLGSMSNSDNNICFMNRQDAALSLWTNGSERLTVSGDGDFDFQSGNLSIGGQTGNTLQTTILGAGVTTLAITKNVVTLTGHVADNTLATITGGLAGQTLTIICVDDRVTITDTDDAGGANTIDLLGTATNFISADDTVLQLIYDGTSWFEVNRSVN